MKKHLLLLIGLFYSISIFAQEYEWASIESEWYYSLPDDAGNPLFSYEKFVPVEEIIIGNKLCKVIESARSAEIMYEEDGKIYYFFQDEFHLIYDFSARIGDEIEFGFKSYSPNSLIIDTIYHVKCVIENIEIVQVDGKELKFFHTSMNPIEDLDHLVWPSRYDYYEQIGYEYGFIFILPIPSIDIVQYLRCFNNEKINFISDWWKYYNKPCDYASSSSVEKYSSTDIEIFPNPVSDELIIHGDFLQQSNPYHIFIFDSNGRKVFEDKIDSQKNKLDISALIPGIYFINIYSDSHFIEPFKIIKL